MAHKTLFAFFLGSIFRPRSEGDGAVEASAPRLGWAIYREMTAPRGVLSCTGLRISQGAASVLLHRLHGAFAEMG